MENATQILIMGVIATLAIDLWALVLKRGFNQQTMDWGLAGRWFAYMPRGVFFHRPIGKTSPVKNEKLIGWSAHYIVGIIYAWMYITLMTMVFSRQPDLFSAVIFGLATVLAPWLIMQPGMGMGVFASKVLNPGLKRLVSLSVHTVFGVGLFVGWWVVN
jgi:hypothetical protein